MNNGLARCRDAIVNYTRNGGDGGHTRSFFYNCCNISEEGEGGKAVGGIDGFTIDVQSDTKTLDCEMLPCSNYLVAECLARGWGGLAAACRSHNMHRYYT